MAEIIRSKINHNIDFIFKPLPQDDTFQREPNIEKAIKELNWKPNISLDKGLEKTISWFKKNINFNI